MPGCQNSKICKARYGLYLPVGCAVRLRFHDWHMVIAAYVREVRVGTVERKHDGLRTVGLNVGDRLQQGFGS